ncbi:MAG: PAS domain S-box protein [Elusimicrobiota bacterium]
MDDNLKSAIIDFLKAFTRIVVQANLYNEDHPEVKAAAEDSLKKLGFLLSLLKGENIALNLSGNKFILNGIQIMTSDKMPNSILNIYKNCHIDTIEFNDKVSQIEMIKFSKIGVSKISPEQYLKENSISNIKILIDKYVRANIKENSKTQENQSIDTDIKNQNFIDSLRTIVSKLTSDTVLQQKLIEELMSKFRKEVEIAIEKAVKEIKAEKVKVENDYIRTESVISNIASSEIMIDKNGNVIMASSEAEKITGKVLKEITGKKIFDVANIEEQMINIAEEIKGISDKKIDPKIKTGGKEDLIKTIKNSTALIKNEEGKIVGTIMVPHDIAKLKEVEQLKSDFISTVTHELRSPLTSIKMALDLISREKIENQTTKTMINAAIRNAERLNSIINDILDFSKLQSGKMTFSFSSENPNDIAQNAVDAMLPWAKSKDLTLNLIKSENVSNIYVDKKRMEQVLINLISNAIKFTPANGKIDVLVEYISSSNTVVFSVKDTGIGIREEDKKKIFEKFVQAAGGEKIGGTGLGLAITKAMVVMQRGTISFESEVGKGSTFKVYMPVDKAQIAQQDTEETLPKKSWWRKILGI